MRFCALMALLLLWNAPAAAHRTSEALLTLRVDAAQVSGRWEIALRDLAAVHDVDANGDLRLTWRELRQALPALRARLPTWVRVDADGAPCTLTVEDLLVNDRLDGRYAWLSLSADCPHAPRAVGIDYRFLATIDPEHRGVVLLEVPGQRVQTTVLGPQRPYRALAPSGASGLGQFREYMRDGIHHIWIGGDHVLFLLTLLLPAVMMRVGRDWLPVPNLRGAVVEVLGVVTAFTVAHSLTLGLAAFDVVRLPSRLVETAIAASVVMAALNNVTPVITRRRWAMAFVFGLVHGFGFASALADMGLPSAARLLSLVAFNLGVEIGQLAIVLIFVPCAYALRVWRHYPGLLLRPASVAVGAVAAAWTAQRLLGA